MDVKGRDRPEWRHTVTNSVELSSLIYLFNQSIRGPLTKHIALPDELLHRFYQTLINKLDIVQVSDHEHKQPSYAVT